MDRNWLDVRPQVRRTPEGVRAIGVRDQFLIVALTLFASMCLLPSNAAAEASLCHADETVVFSCSVGSKLVSVCATADLADVGGSLQYRFGKAGAVELAYPENPKTWRTVATSGVMMLAGGGGAHLAFDRGDYRYVVYTAIGRGWGEKAGLLVERGGDQLKAWPCTDTVQSQLGPVLFSQGSFPKDEQGFHLP